MTGAVHTPGPWVLQDGFNTIYTTSDPINRVGTTIAIAKVLENQCEASEVVPNARLIAAAPELLEALDRALAVLIEHYGAPGSEYPLPEIRAAIAKAKGIAA